MSRGGPAGARSRARELVVQALYQQQIAEHDTDELIAQFSDRPEYQRVDQEYFLETLRGISGNIDAIDRSIGAFADRPPEQLDPVERAILMQGIHELQARRDVPFKVVINEAVNLARKFGAADAHKYVNAVLDRAARQIRSDDND
ncbi:MAG: transcription antitermination factor NusB [Gammaproteobacteria bacterium]|nr:transcription antitermination factor NusB [Gammaproteobacteria bacterium]